MADTHAKVPVKKEDRKVPQVTATVIKATDHAVNELGGPLDSDVIRSTAREYEDEFKGKYGMGMLYDSVNIIEPPYNMLRLQYLAEENNALAPCIDAMVTNIDGTGYVIEPEDEGSDSETEGDEVDEVIDTKIKNAEDFFAEPWMGQSFITLRKKLRRDLETMGNAYLEVIRSLAGEIVFIRHIDAKTMRIVALDQEVVVKKKFRRGGREIELKVGVRERRFVQSMNSKRIFFREFNSSRNLDRSNGRWELKGETLSAQKRANEMIHFTVNKDQETPYGVPRYTSQIPSVLGSRKAEEFNLTFFDSGGVPPMLILVQGGEMAPAAKKALQNSIKAGNKSKHEPVVIEAHNSSGSIDGANTVRVTVERFGAERQQDSMFEKYDEKCEQRIRRAFRLPPIMVGKSEDYSFATAFASYTVAEAQVFAPEREEFDEIINLSLMKEMFPGYKLRSLPLTVKNVDNQLKAIEIASNKGAIDKEQTVKALNEITNLELVVSKEPDVPPGMVLGPDGMPVPQQGQPTENEQPPTQGDVPPAAQGNGTPVKSPTAKFDIPELPILLAQEMAEAIDKGASRTSLAVLGAQIGSLTPEQLTVYRAELASLEFGPGLSNPAFSAELGDAATLLLQSSTGRIEDAG